MEELHVPGVVVVVVKDGEFFFAKGYGYADVEKGIAVDPETTLFGIGSTSKLFTWTAVMQLAEQGKLDLDADVDTYFDLKIPATYPEPITMKHLLSHTPGFEDLNFEAVFPNAEQSVPLGEWLAAHIPARVRRPGELTAYSNYGNSRFRDKSGSEASPDAGLGLAGTVRIWGCSLLTIKTGIAALTLMSTMGGWDIEMGWDPKEEAKKQRALAGLGPGITDLLLIAAESPNPPFREGIITALAMMADERAVNVLVRSLDHDFAALRRKVTSGLVRIGEAAVDPLINAAASDQADVRQYAVFCLGRIGDRRAKPAFLEALDDGETKVRRYAIKALGGMTTVGDVERFKQVLRKETWDNAVLAAEVVESIGDEGRQALLEMALSERNPAAAYLVALNGDPRRCEVLVEWLSGEDGRKEDAVEFLRELGDEHCIPFLVEGLKTATGERGRSIALELGRIGSEAAVKALIEALSVDNRLTRRGAVRALGEIGDPTFIEPLIRCLARDDDPKVQRLVATVLAEIGEAAEGPLRKALEENRIRGKHRQNQAKHVLWKLRMSM
jgi:HEAT repeat protein